MSATFIIYILILLSLLFLSAFFSSSETALFSLSHLDIVKLEKRKAHSTSLIKTMLKTPRKTLIAILFGNTIVNILFFSISTLLSVNLKENYGELAVIVGGLISLFSVILFGEVLPKAIAAKRPITTAIMNSYLLYFFYKILINFTTVLDSITNFFCSILGVENKEKYVTEEDLKLLFTMGQKEGVIGNTEHGMLLDLLDLSNIRVKELMIPRVDMLKADISFSSKKIYEIFCQKKAEHIIIYDRYIDNICGILYAKDFFLNQTQSISSLIYELPFVLENMSVKNLLTFFDENVKHSALIVDEYGGIEGFISMENILEELVGEIEDEYDHKISMVEKITENHYHVSGKFPLKELQEIFHIEYSENHCDTISGLIMFLLQRLPKKGDKIQYQNLFLEILEVHKYRVQKISLQILDNKLAIVDSKKNNVQS